MLGLFVKSSDQKNAQNGEKDNWTAVCIAHEGERGGGFGPATTPQGEEKNLRLNNPLMHVGRVLQSKVRVQIV